MPRNKFALFALIWFIAAWFGLLRDNIGNALAGRAVGQHLREMGVMTGGPAPMDKGARSRFL